MVGPCILLKQNSVASDPTLTTYFRWNWNMQIDGKNQFPLLNGLTQDQVQWVRQKKQKCVVNSIWPVQVWPTNFRRNNWTCPMSDRKPANRGSPLSTDRHYLLALGFVVESVFSWTESNDCVGIVTGRQLGFPPNNCCGTMHKSIL